MSATTEITKEHSAGSIGVVVIGRNEGERLKRCINSILRQSDTIVYVDSGSSDGSVAHAQTLGIECVQLDMSIPFNAGRARNEGFYRLIQKQQQLLYVQFIDGDCELQEGWLAAGSQFLDNNSAFAVVAGRNSERYPEQSIYNLLCEIEWNTPVGEAASTGGIFMVRKSAFEAVKGFNPTLIAGEEPELCYRLRRLDWLVFRLDHPMSIHDAAITRFSQWWKRSVRTGHAYAQGYALHAREGQRYCLRESAKAWFWAFLFPFSVLALALNVHMLFLALAALYPAQIIKIGFYAYKRSGTLGHAIFYGFFTVLGKWPQFLGQLLFITRRLQQKNYTIVEYK